MSRTQASGLNSRTASTTPAPLVSVRTIWPSCSSRRRKVSTVSALSSARRTRMARLGAATARMRIFEAERRARFVERQGAGRAGRDFRAQVARQGDDHAQALLGQRLGKLGERALRLLLDLRQLVQYFLRVHCTPFLGIHPSKNARQPQSDDGESLVADLRQAVT